MYLTCVISKCVFVTTTTPARIRTPPAPVSGFVTVTTPARICTPPAPVSGIQQHTDSLTNILFKKLLENYIHKKLYT